MASGGLFHGIQLWVNLPAAQKWVAPNYQDISAERVTLLRSADGGALVRLIAGDVGGHSGPGSTHTAIAVAHATVSPGAELTLPWNPTFNALVYALAGRGTVGPDQRPIGTGQLAVFGPGDSVTVAAAASPGAGGSSLEVLLLGGQPIREPVAWYGPFVMNTEAEIAQALDDFEAGRMGTVPAGALGAG